MKSKNEMRLLFTGFSKLIRDMERHVLEVVRHPKAKPENLAEVHEMYTHAYSRWAAVRSKLQQKYPDTGLPWNSK